MSTHRLYPVSDNVGTNCDSAKKKCFDLPYRRVLSFRNTTATATVGMYKGQLNNYKNACIKQPCTQMANSTP